MRDLLIALTVLGFIVYQVYFDKNNMGFVSAAPLYSGKYVEVYGKKDDIATEAMMRYLDDAGVNFNYVRLEKQENWEFISKRLKNAGDERHHWDLPIVDINGQITTNPDPDKIIVKYLNASS
ncbi:thioredoxin domain-containing protein [Algicola sagamiensis]|uniref:hypothetical protein n=1 Tax=Algicola sagamiensis TaxID=163869 RepID=UPI0003A0799E|nr:hypothetical protein [Algicola sagamiensis]